jgi:hypothetical protein
MTMKITGGGALETHLQALLKEIRFRFCVVTGFQVYFEGMYK